MHLLVMGMNYAPERTSVGPFTTELCEYMAGQGHRVTVLTTFPHYPEWRVHEGYRGKLFMRERVRGIDVRRGYAYLPTLGGALPRIMYDTSLAVTALLSGLLLRDRVDLILAVCPPLQLGVSAHFLSRKLRAPFVFLIQDIVPDAAVALGIMRNRSAISLAHQMEHFIYRRAAAIPVVCDGFRDNLIRKGVPEGKIIVLPNWIDVDFVRPRPRHNGFRQAMDIRDGSFLVLHTGNMGTKQGLANVVEAAARLEGKNNVEFLLVGDGSEKSSLVARARDLGLTNVRFADLQPRQMIPDMLAAADVLLLNQRAGVVDMSIPSKLLSYMAAGRPTIAAVNPSSEAARVIQEAQGGTVVEPESPSALAEGVSMMARDQDSLSWWGVNARTYVEQRFARDKVLLSYEQFLVGLVDHL